MTWLPDFLAAGALAAGYGFVIVAILLGLRRFDLPTSGRLALAPVLAQSALSLAFQCGLLAGSTLLAGALASALVVGSLLWTVAHRGELAVELDKIWCGLRAHCWITLPLAIVLLYALAQCLLLPVRNYDALTYHLPRVFLFMQEGSFFLDSFNRYHQAVFPVGADVLFFPYVALGLSGGLAIFSLGSYVSIGLSAFTVARSYGSPKNAALCALVILSLTEIVLQAISVKNDLLMAGVAGGCLVLALRLTPRPDLGKLLLLAVLTAFGISVKTTFIAFIPGLALLVLIQTRLWTIERLRQWLRALPTLPIPVLLTCVAVLVLSNVWLFAWNSFQYGGWSGPESFTHRHQQHDGLTGGAANLMRYGLQILQGTYLSDIWLSATLNQPPFSDQLTGFYRETIEPLVGSAGATREPFSIYWLHDENFAWFGPLGALLCFLCLPYALIRHPRRAWPALLPALGFLLIVALKISWMPWNGRFFSAFFVGLVPALALSLSGLRTDWLRRSAAVVALLLLLLVKSTDFSNPVWLPRLPDPAATPAYRQFSLMAENRTWSKLLQPRPLHAGDPQRLLSPLPTGASIGLYTNGHRMSYDFFRTRPDLKWVPLDRIRGEGEIAISEALGIFLKSELDYLLIMSVDSPAWGDLTVTRSSDGAALVLRHPAGPEPAADGPSGLPASPL